MDSSQFRKQYEENRLLYVRFTEKLRLMIRELLESNDIKVALIEDRTKDIDSFVEKILRKNYTNPLEQITDLSGIRVVLYTLEDVEKVSSLIRQTFKIDRDRSINKANILEADRFGYLSQHYIVQISDSRSHLFEWKDYKDLWGEVQVRTVLQHSWAAIQHSLDYKSKKGIPKKLKRRLFRLMALFELADEEFNHIKDDAQKLLEEYKEQIESDVPDIELNVDSLKAYLMTSEVVKEWADYIKSLGYNVNNGGWFSRDVEMANFVGLSKINEIDFLLKNSKEWGRAFFKDAIFNSSGSQEDRSKVTLDVNGIVTYLLIANYLDKFDKSNLEGKFGFGLAEYVTEPARKYNPKFKN